MDKFIDSKGEELFVITDGNQLLKKKKEKKNDDDNKGEVLSENEQDSSD